MSLEAEKAVLGIILKNPNKVDECYLQSGEFHQDERHGLILKTLIFAKDKFQGSKDPFDPVIMAEHWGANIAKIGGISYLVHLRSTAFDVGNFDQYQKIVRNAHIQHKASKALGEALAGDIDITAVKEQMEELSGLQNNTDQPSMVKVADVLVDHHKEIGLLALFEPALQVVSL